MQDALAEIVVANQSEERRDRADPGGVERAHERLVIEGREVIAVRAA